MSSFNVALQKATDELRDEKADTLEARAAILQERLQISREAAFELVAAMPARCYVWRRSNHWSLDPLAKL